MKVVHVPCGPAVNESERKALAQIKARLIAKPGGDEWLLLSNLAFSTTHLRQSDEIDIVAIGPPGVQVVEVKHWTETWVKRYPALVEHEAERVSEKARKIGTTLRKQVANLPKVDGVFLITQAASKIPTIKDIGPVRGVPFHTLKTCDDAVGLFAERVLSQDEIRKLGEALEPKSAVAVDGTLKRIADYARLKILTPRDQRFHRVYDATHTSRQDQVKLHVYDLSDGDDAKALKKAEREWKSLNRLQRYDWAPRIVDSFQDAPGYPGEIKFFTMADPLAPSIEKRAADESWDTRARLIFARSSVRALQEFHKAHSDGEKPMVHRNLTPRAILVRHDNSPIFTGFEQTRIPDEVTVASPVAKQEWKDEVAPEVRKQGLGGADQRSDVFSLCASLAVLFRDADDEFVAEIADTLASGAEDEPQRRLSLSKLDEGLSKLLGEEKPPPPPPSARYWTEDQIVPFKGDSYRIVSSLGSGGVGTAFKVVKLDRETHEDLGTYVAKVARDKEPGQSVLRSYELARAHTGHSELSTIFEVAPEWRSNSFVALMSWEKGEPLKEQTGYISLLADDLHQESGEGLALEWLRNALGGLSVLHGNGLIHGDISPRNMIVSETELVLTDYDCVTKIGVPATSPGTVLYSSPSRLNGLDASPSDDLYALAASFFHVLFGREPFSYGGNQEKGRGLNWDGASRDEYPLLSKFLNRATNPDSTKRFASVAEAHAVLNSPQNAASAPKISTPEVSGDITNSEETFRMGSMTKSEPIERRENEVEWLESLLQAYPGSRWGNSETRGLDSEFAAATYVETNLEQALYRDIVERRISLVILCGNAGDGKTALLQHLAQRLGLEKQSSATRIVKGRLNDGLTVRMNLDGSASWHGRSADDLLDEFLKPFQNGPPVEDIVHLLAINDGRLLEWIERDEELPLKDDLWDLLEENPPPSSSHIRFVNLNHRSLVGGIAKGEETTIETSFLHNLVDALYGGTRATEIWSPCRTCSAQERCEVFRANRVFGPVKLAETANQDRSRERLFELLQAVHLRGETHITVRELRATLVYILFGIHNCRDYHTIADGSYSPEPYWDRAFSPDALGRQGEVLQELPRFDPGLEAHPQIDRRLLHPPVDTETADCASPKELDLKSARRRAYFEWTRGEIKDLTGHSDALGLTGGRHLRRFRDIAIVDDAKRTELVRDLCGGISRLEALPPLALKRPGKVPLRISPRTPTETAYWVEKSLCDFHLEADLPGGDLRDGDGQDLLQRQASLIYSYRDGRKERLRLGADLFRLLLELNDGYQLGDVASDDTFAHLSIFVQRLVQEDHRKMLAWNPMREDRIFKIVAKSENADSEPKKILTIAPIENPELTNGE